MSRTRSLVIAMLVMGGAVSAATGAMAQQKVQQRVHPQGYYIDSGDRSGRRTYVQPHARDTASPYMQSTQFDRRSRQYSQVTPSGRGFSWVRDDGWPYRPLIYGE